MNSKAPFVALVALAAMLSAIGFVIMSRAGTELLVLWQAGVAHLILTALMNRRPRPGLVGILKTLGRNAYPAHASAAIVLLASGVLGWSVDWALGGGLAVLAACAWASNTVALYRATQSE